MQLLLPSSSVFYFWYSLYFIFVQPLYCGLGYGNYRKRLEAFKQSNRLEYPAELFNRGKILSHLWAEYKQTLHEQRFINPQTSIEGLAAIRSTIPAEAIFSPTVLVDSQLHAEFFKHLPGILTGMGIIRDFFRSHPRTARLPDF